MPDPLHSRDEEEAALDYVAAEARRYLAELEQVPVLASRDERFGGSLPEEGDGALTALAKLVAASDVATRSSGPRFFHLLTGGATPGSPGAGRRPSPRGDKG